MSDLDPTGGETTTTPTLQTLVAEGFAPDTTREFAPTYLERLQTGWDQLEVNLRRTGLLLVLTFVLFELLQDATLGELEIGPLKLNDVEGIVRILPAVSAFLIFELFSLFEARSRYSHVHTTLMRMLHPELEKRDLDVLLWPPTLDISGVARGVELGQPKNLRQLAVLEKAGTGVLVIIVVGGFALEMSQIWRLYDRFGFDDIVTWLVVAFAALNLFRAGAVFSIPPLRP